MMFVDNVKITDAIDSVIDSMLVLHQEKFTGFILATLHQLASSSKDSATCIKFNLSQLAQDIDVYYPIRVNSGIDTEECRYVADGCTDFDWRSMCEAMRDDLHDVVHGVKLLAENDLETTCHLDEVANQISQDLLTLTWFVTMCHKELINKNWYKPYNF